MVKTLRGIAFLLLCVAGAPAHSGLMFSYEFATGDVVTAIFEGGFTDAANPDNFIPTSATSLALNGVAHSNPGITNDVVATSGFFGPPGGSFPDPYVAVDGSDFDATICDFATCFEGLILFPTAFGGGVIYTDFGPDFDPAIGPAIQLVEIEGDFSADRVSISPVPVPATLALLGLGLGYARLRRKSVQNA